MPAPFILGWEEWLALPDLGVPAIKAKIDTGARTSALHAFHIEPFGPIAAPLVRFTVHPVRRRDDIEIACSAPITDRREVTSSNGERELRYVIQTRVAIGDREWPIEVTLTNRETMSYRMLLGRQAIQEDMYVDPASSFRQPKLSGKAYRKMPRKTAVHRPLRIAILTRKPGASAPVRLAAAASERGHVVETIDLTRLTLGFDGLESLCVDGHRLVPHFDAVIPRIGVGGGRESVFERAVLRQLEVMGSFTPIRADVLERLSQPIAVRQTLLRHGIESIGPARLGEADIGAALDDRADLPRLSLLVIGGRALAADRQAEESAEPDASLAASAQELALRVATALQLRLVAVDLVAAAGTLRFAGFDTAPRLSVYSRAGDEDAGALIITDIEGAARSWRRLPMAPPAAIVTDVDADPAGG